MKNSTISKSPFVGTVVAALLVASSAYAVPVVYEGLDVGAGSLAAAPNSQAASDAFDAATGSLNLVDFDANPAAGLTFSNGSVTNAPSCGFALCGGNTTAGGSFFLRQSGGLNTITFDTAIDAFGAYFSGWQLGTQTITYTDGSTVTLDMPEEVVVSSGGMVFYGFVDAGASIMSITYDASNDIVALDDIRFGQVAAVPLPAGGLLMLGGLAAFGAMRRRK